MHSGLCIQGAVWTSNCVPCTPCEPQPPCLGAEPWKAYRWAVQMHPLLEQVCEKRALRPQVRVECSADVLFLQGDFSQALMELMAPQLNATATALNHFALNGTLGSAIQNSAARSDDPAILSCLSVRISRPASQLEKGVGLHKPSVLHARSCSLELQPGVVSAASAVLDTEDLSSLEFMHICGA